MATVTVRLFDSRIRQMAGWTGEVGRSVSRLVDRMETAQRKLAPAKTGALKASIRQGRKGRWVRGIETTVGANPMGGFGPIGVAMWQDQGTRPHVILPKPSNTKGHMTFFWVKMGRMAYPRRVFHPGNPAVHWAEEGALYGMLTWR